MPLMKLDVKYTIVHISAYMIDFECIIHANYTISFLFGKVNDLF